MLAKFLEYLRYELNRAPLTVEAYENDIRQFADWKEEERHEKIDFTLVSTTDIRLWLASRAKEGDTSRTLRRKIISLRMFYKWLVKKDHLKVSPVQNIPLPKIPQPLPDFIKPGEIEKVISEMTAENEETGETMEMKMKALIVEMLYTLGIRRSELANINDDDISFFNSDIKITGKRSKQRIIPLPESLLRKIEEWQKLRDFSENDEKAMEKTALFRHKGRRITPQKIYEIVHDALGSTTAKKKSPHALRHSFASGMLNGGADIDSVREFLGHESLATTQIYTHISVNEIKRAYKTAHPRSKK